MADFFHGARAWQVPTRLVPSARVSAAITMAFGCAPIHRLPQELQDRVLPGNVALIFEGAEAEQFLGMKMAADDFDKWDLSAVAFTIFNLYNFAPVLFVNLFDPAKHNKSITGETLRFIAGKAQLENGDVIGSVTLASSSDSFEEGEDFELNIITGEMTVIEGSDLEAALQIDPAMNFTANYKYAAPELVTAEDCIGGYDVATGKTTGLELVEDVFPRFDLVPGSLVAPRFAKEDPVVAMIMAAKTQRINGVFTCVAVADIPTLGVNAVKLYTDVPAYKNKNSLVSENLYLCWPTTRVGEREVPLSVHAAAIFAFVDDANFGIPFASPSNKNLVMQAAVADDSEISLTLPKANYLNANGITTAINFRGWKLWGNRTSAYPGNLDPKDSFVSNRRMFAWYGNRLVLTYFSQVDNGINNRLIQTIVNSEQMFINSLEPIGAVVGGRIEAPAEDNPIINVMDGMIRFRVFLGTPPPAEDIGFILEFDPTYLEALFG